MRQLMQARQGRVGMAIHEGTQGVRGEGRRGKGISSVYGAHGGHS
jgi:hypothetical protein